MSEDAAAACRAEELVAFAARFEAARRDQDEARTVGKALLEGGLSGPTPQASVRPEPCA